MARIELIAALDTQRAIGRDNQMPWHLPNDLKRFKALTRGGTILMGRKTAESLGRALPERRNLVLTRHGRVPFDGMQAVASVDEALADVTDEAVLHVIGGGEVYSQFLPYANALRLTHVETSVESADAFFPVIDFSQWRCVAEQFHPIDQRHAYAMRFADYERIAP